MQLIRYITFALLTTSAQAVRAQDVLDSLEHVISALPQDTSRLPVLTELIRATVFNEPERALGFAERYRDIALASGDALHLGKGYNFTGMCHSMVSQYDLALTNYLLALPNFERSGEQWYVAMAHNNIGSVHEKMRNFDKATVEFGSALSLFRELGDTVWVANVSSNLGNINYEQARYDSSITYYELADRMLTTTGKDVFAATIRMNLANAYGKTGDGPRALRMMRNAQSTMPEGENENTRATIVSNLGRLLGLVGKQDSALYYMRQGLALAEQTQERALIANTHEFLSDFFDRLGRSDSALVHYKLMRVIRDSIFNAERSEQVAEMQERFESGRKDAQLAENRATLEQRSITIKAFAAGGTFLLLAAIFAFRAYRIKRRGEAELARKNVIIEGQLKEKELLVREIHHRVKNNLQLVSSLLSIQGRGITDTIAKQAVQDSRSRVKSMALIHQDLYREGDLTGVEMGPYLEKLATSLIAGHAAAGRVELTVDVGDLDLDVDTAVPLGLILNELITNALKYAWPDDRPGTLHLGLCQEGGALHLLVRDNGVGYDGTTDPDPKGTGFGLGMVRSFAAKLKAEWTIRGDNGTTVEMFIRNFKLAR